MPPSGSPGGRTSTRRAVSWRASVSPCRCRARPGRPPLRPPGPRAPRSIERRHGKSTAVGCRTPLIVLIPSFWTGGSSCCPCSPSAPRPTSGPKNRSAISSLRSELRALLAATFVIHAGESVVAARIARAVDAHVGGGSRRLPSGFRRCWRCAKSTRPCRRHAGPSLTACCRDAEHHDRSVRPAGAPHGLRRHAATWPRRVRTAHGKSPRAGHPAPGGRRRGQSHRHGAILWAQRGQ